MLVEPVTTSGKDMAPLAQARSPAKAVTSQNDQRTEKAGVALASSRLREVADQVQKNIKMFHNVNLHFSVQQATGQIVVTVRDEDTGKIIRQIPPSQMLDLAARLEEMAGLIFDQKG